MLLKATAWLPASISSTVSRSLCSETFKARLLIAKAGADALRGLGQLQGARQQRLVRQHAEQHDVGQQGQAEAGAVGHAIDGRDHGSLEAMQFDGQAPVALHAAVRLFGAARTLSVHVAQVQGVTGFNLFTPAAVRLGIIGRAFDYRTALAALSAPDKARVRVIVPLGDKVLQPVNTRAYWAGTGLTVDAIAGEGHLYHCRNAADFAGRLALLAG